jgi:hypothetical protein
MVGRLIGLDTRSFLEAGGVRPMGRSIATSRRGLSEKWVRESFRELPFRQSPGGFSFRPVIPDTNPELGAPVSGLVCPNVRSSFEHVAAGRTCYCEQGSGDTRSTKLSANDTPYKVRQSPTKEGPLGHRTPESNTEHNLTAYDCPRTVDDLHRSMIISTSSFPNTQPCGSHCLASSTYMLAETSLFTSTGA